MKPCCINPDHAVNGTAIRPSAKNSAFGGLEKTAIPSLSPTKWEFVASAPNSRAVYGMVLIVLILVFSLAAPQPGQAQTLLPIPGLTAGDPGTFRYDAGLIDVIRTPRLERVFTFRNTTPQPLTISGLRGSCGCETLLLRPGGQEKQGQEKQGQEKRSVPTMRLAPGQQAEIALQIHLHSGQSGPALKYVWVDGAPTASGQASVLTTLEIDMTLRQSVSFTPSVLAFGKVGAGTSASRTLTATFDGDLFPAAAPPVLQSAIPEMKVLPVGRPQRVELEDRTVVRQAYQVTLASDAPAGRLSSELRFADSALLDGISLPVSATVSGALDALPASVFFGSLPAGTPVARSVVLTTAALQSDASLRVTSSAAWLQATLDRSSAPTKHHLLSIMLTRQAPGGSVQEKVTVALSSGEHLSIPVVAELTH